MAEDEIVPLLAEGNNQENIKPGCISGATCQERTETRPEIILPNGKEYHIFISFTSEDRPYVTRLKNALDVMGLKCMLAEDDFISGIPIMQNIQTFIEKSHKLLLVVSETFLQKPFCNWEVEIGHKYAADHNRNDYMIVLRLDECEMPLKLGYMTNISGVGREIEDVALKVNDAYLNRADDPRAQSQNGCEILRMYPTEISQRLWCNSGYQFIDIPASEEYRLGCYSMKESAEFYREMMKCANDHSLIKRYAVFSRSRKFSYFFVLFLCGIQAVFTSIYLLVTQLSGNDLSISQLLLLSLAWLILAVCLYIALLKYLYRQMMNKLTTILKTNTNCATQGFIVLPRQYRRTIFISFIYYDMRECLNFLKQRAREHWPNASEEDIAGTEDDQNEETCVMKIVGNEIENESRSIGHEISSSKQNEELCVENGFGMHSTISESSENAETCLMKEANNENETSHALGVCTQSIEGGTPPTGAVGTLHPNPKTYQRSEVHDSQVPGDITSLQQPQMIATEDHLFSLSDSEMSTALNDFEKVVAVPYEEEEQCFLGERTIDEETQEKVYI